MTSVRRSILEVLFPVLPATAVEDETGSTGNTSQEEGIEDEEKAKNNASATPPSAPPDGEAEQNGPATPNHQNGGGESALLDRREGGKNGDASNKNEYNEKNTICSICLEQIGMYELPFLQ
jgi:hypothetical protein